MANVPIVNDTKVADKHIDFDYNKLQFNEDMFGANVYEALDKLGKTGANISAQVGKKVDEWNKTKIVDITNQLDSYTNTALYDKDNGYFYKTGENAMGQSDTVMADYDSFAKELLEKSNLSGDYLDMAKSTVASKRNNIFKSVHKHDADETKNWQSNVYSQKEANFLNQAILDRNDDERLAHNLNQGYNVINLQAQLQEWDQPTVDLKKKEFASKYHIAVINGLLGDGSLRAKQYYEAHKNEIDPNKHNQILNAVNSNDLKYNSNQLADEFMLGAKSEEEALQKAYAIENIDLSDATANRIKQKYSEIKRLNIQKENELIDGFYDVVLQKQQNGQPLSYDDIPDELSSKEKISLMKYINQNGQPTSEDDIWQELYYMSVNNAQGFVNVDLNRYKGYLTDGEFKQFLKRQEDIKTGKYQTQIKDDDKMINDALKAIGLNRNSVMPWGADKKDIAYSEIRAMVREFEARKGRAITDTELMDITNSLGYKDQEGVMLYKQLEQGMRERTGFIKDVMNDFVYYQSKHNGEMPPNDEKMKIIQQRINQKVQEQNQEISEAMNIASNQFQGKTITSKYGIRTAPKKGASTNHKGIDLAYQMNEPIGAFVEGKVVYTGYNDSLGNYVGIKDKNGAIHNYGHTNKVLVKRGDKINKGDIIANAGSTGVSTGPHLHYSVTKADKYVDPVKYNEQNKTVEKNTENYTERIATDAKGNKALVQVDSNGKIVKVIREI